MGEGQSEQIARLDERDRHLGERLDRIETKVDRLIEQMGDQRVVVAKWSGSISLLVSVAAAFAVQAVI